MIYSLHTTPSCKQSIAKACKKNKVLQQALSKKIKALLIDPLPYKVLKYGFKGMRRVHVLSSYVLIFEVDEKNKTVTLISFEHHDEAYRR